MVFLTIIVVAVIVGVLIYHGQKQGRNNDKVFGLDQALAVVKHPRLRAVAQDVRYAAVAVLGYTDTVVADAQTKKQGLEQAVTGDQGIITRIRNEELPGAERSHADQLKRDNDGLVAKLDLFKASADREVARLEAKIARARQRYESKAGVMTAKADAVKAGLEAELASVKAGYAEQVKALQASIDANQAELAELAQVMQVFAAQAN